MNIKPYTRPAQAGVTLIELMTVMVVLAILASIAVPSYRSYMLRTNRTDAKSALMQLQAAQEKFYLQNNAYTDKVTAKAADGGLGLLDTTSHGFYQLGVTLKKIGGVDGQGYTATATPITGKGQSDDAKCATFSIDDAGNKTVTGSMGSIACWK